MWHCPSPGGCSFTYPEHPLESHSRRDHQTLEQQAQTTLASGEATIEETNAWDDEPDDEGAEDEVGVVVFVAGILGVNVFGGVATVATPGLRGVIFGLRDVSDRYRMETRMGE